MVGFTSGIELFNHFVERSKAPRGAVGFCWFGGVVDDDFLREKPSGKLTVAAWNIYIYTSSNKGSIFQPAMLDDLVGGFTPFEKYARQIGSFPHISG